MDSMGEKTRARANMEKAGVPVVPGSIAPFPSVGEARTYAEKIGFPSWVEVDVKKMTGTFKGAPDRSEFGQDINESLVVELYSK